MAFALVGSAGAATQNAVGVAVTPAWGTSENRTAGNLLVLWASVTGIATLPTTPSGWTIAKQVAGTSCSATVYYRIATGADATPTVAAITSGVIAAQLAEFSGNHASPFDQSGSATGISSPVTATFGAADVETGALVVACGADFRSVARTPNDTWTGTNWTATAAGNNNGTSSVNHYSNAYSLATTGSASADTAVMTASVTTSLTGLAVAAVSFVAASTTKTRLFFQQLLDPTYRSNVGIGHATLAGGTSNRFSRAVTASRGAGPASVSAQAVTGPTAGIEVGPNSATVSGFISRPLAAAVTISGPIRFSLWAYETNAADNAAVNCAVYKVSGADGTASLVHRTVRSVEVTVGSPATVNNFTETPAAGVDFARGDRIMLVPFFDDAGTMAQPGTDPLLFWTDGTGGSGATPYDSLVVFSETLAFEGTTPTGTQVFLTDGAAAGVGGKEAWTSRGSGVVSAVTNTAAGPTSGIQITASAGGAAIEWYTRTLAAMTLSGLVLVNATALESSASANAMLVCEIAVTNGDGSSPVVWATNGVFAVNAELGTSEAAYTSWLEGPDMAVSSGQRLRVRFRVDDAYDVSAVALNTLAAGFTATLNYAGAAGASGDTYLTFTQTLTEYTAVSSVPSGQSPYLPIIPQ